MARKIIAANYPNDFENGNGQPDLAIYAAYHTDLDECFDEILVVLDGVIDEVNASNLANNALPADILRPTTQAAGRFGVNDAKITRATNAITLTSGRIFAAGQKITVVGNTLNVTPSGSDNQFIATDLAGLLSLQSSAAQRNFDIAEIQISGSAIDSIDDNLGLLTLSPLLSGDTIHRIPHRIVDDDTPVDVGIDDPTIRLQDNVGVDQDAGWYHSGTDSELSFASQRATSEGVGARVEGHRWTARGQLQMFEQARLMLSDNSTSAGTSDALTALSMTADRAEPLSYGADPWGSTPATSYTQPSGDQYEGTYMVSGFVEFNSGATGQIQAEIRVGSTRVAFDRKDVPGAGAGVISLSGLADITGGATVDIRASCTGGTLTITEAQMGLVLVAGRAAP